MSRQPSPSGEAGPRRVAAPVLLAVLILALAVLRIAAAAVIPLTEDEAYYRLWAQHPAFGYYDHPPMVAWWIWAGTHLAGDTALGVRLLPVLSSLLTTALVFDLGARLGERRTGIVAAIFYNATLTVGAGAILAIPDAPASLFWVAALWLMARAVQDDSRWWLGAGLAAGLACLAKYSALFLAPGVLLWLLLTADGRRQLARPWPWLAALMAAAIFGANIAWNADHHWLTFAKQFGRVAPGRFAPRYLVELLTAQFLLLTPPVAILAGLGGARALQARERALVPIMALATSAPFFAYLLLHSLHDRVQAHWPVPLYPAAAILAAFALDAAAGWRVKLGRWAPAGFALTALALIDMAMPQGLLGRGDPAAQLRGWPDFAGKVEALRSATGAGWVGSLSYGVGSQLQAQPTIHIPVLQLNERDRYADMAPPATDLSGPGLVVDLERRIDRTKLAACFEQVGPVRRIDRGDSPGPDGRYAALVVAGPKTDLLKTGCGA